MFCLMSDLLYNLRETLTAEAKIWRCKCRSCKAKFIVVRDDVEFERFFLFLYRRICSCPRCKKTVKI